MTASSSAVSCACSKAEKRPRMPSLSEDERQALLRLAREAVTQAVSFNRLPAQVPSGGAFPEKPAVFVTLPVRERFRACIGAVEPYHLLGETTAPLPPPAHPPPPP